MKQVKTVVKNVLMSSLAGVAATSMVACKKSNSNSVPTVTTSFEMSGSSAPKTVARTNIEKWLSKLMPQATANTAPPLVDAANSSISLNELWVVIKEIEFKAAQTAAQEDSSEATEGSSLHGPYVANLLQATPSILDTEAVPAKTYHRMKIQYEKVDTSKLPAAAPAGLANNSIYLTGSAGGYSFSYSMNDGVELDISTPNGIPAAEGQKMLFSVEIANVIRKIDFTTLNALPNTANRNISATNRISGTHLCDTVDTNASQDYYNCFRKALESEANFGQDDKGNGELGAHSSKK